MRRWFSSLPIHRKLVAMALVVTAAALVLATTGLILLDLWRYRETALGDTAALAEVIAENTAAAVTFKDSAAAAGSLSTVRVRSTVQRACLYLPDGGLFAGFERSSVFVCPPTRPTGVPWQVIAGSAPIRRNDRVIGLVYVERDLTEINSRIAVTGLTGIGMLLIAGGFAFVLAHRVNRSVSAPITQLANAARAIQPDADKLVLPDVHAGQDEVGDLVRSFTEMLRRVHEANARLVESNDRLRRQEAEREGLLVREREVSRLKDEFLAAVSHELRTPLNAILGWVQILTTTTVDEKTAANALARIARNAKVQARVIDDLIDVSRIVTGKVHLTFESIDLRDVVKGCVDDIRPTAQAKGIELTVDAPSQPCVVRGDRIRLQQVVWNLLSNAIAFTPPAGAVSLSLTIVGDLLELNVRDTGVGISEAFLPHVFDRFRQADGSITREHGGLGLGLAIVKELTELHGGTVSVSSAGADLGASFLVRLPRLVVSLLPSIGDGRKGQGDPVPRLTGVRVLAVDDNADSLEVLSALLVSSGAQVRVAASGAEALRQWSLDPADVLICDLAMPHVDGFDVLRGVRQLDEERGGLTAAIALTAHASADYQTRARDAGFDGHLSKPYDVAELVRSILSALERCKKSPCV